MDAQGKYKVQVVPGEYEVCVAGECSDPISIRMGEYSVYGQRLPRAVPPPQEVPLPRQVPEKEVAAKPVKPGKSTGKK